VENISKNNINSEEKYDDDNGRPGSGYSEEWAKTKEISFRCQNKRLHSCTNTLTL
jgi:hypothetical protein